MKNKPFSKIPEVIESFEKSGDTGFRVTMSSLAIDPAHKDSEAVGPHKVGELCGPLYKHFHESNLLSRTVSKSVRDDNMTRKDAVYKAGYEIATSPQNKPVPDARDAYYVGMQWELEQHPSLTDAQKPDPHTVKRLFSPVSKHINSVSLQTAFVNGIAAVRKCVSDTAKVQEIAEAATGDKIPLSTDNPAVAKRSAVPTK